jgi:hypothetical protein
MIAPLDVFVMIGDNDYQLLGCAGTLHEALELIEKTGPGGHLLFSETTRHKNIYEVGPEGRVSLLARDESGGELSV